MASQEDKERASKPTDDEILQETCKTLITANHILHKKHVVDAYGHISVRHPSDSSKFIMSASVAPGLVASRADLITYHVKDASPVDSNARKGYQERYIHSEIYKRYDQTMSVVHSHSEEVLPFGIVDGVKLRPVFHIAGFLGHSCPIYKIGDFYDESATQDMLVNTQPLGSALASKFSSRFTTTSLPDHNAVVMQNHGFTVVGQSIQQAVFRAVYTHVNASLQMKAIALQAAIGHAGDDKIGYLDEKQVAGCTAMGNNSFERPWGLWVKEVATDELYDHESKPAARRDTTREPIKAQSRKEQQQTQPTITQKLENKLSELYQESPITLTRIENEIESKVVPDDEPRPRSLAREIMYLTIFFGLFWVALILYVWGTMPKKPEVSEL